MACVNFCVPGFDLSGCRDSPFIEKVLEQAPGIPIYSPQLSFDLITDLPGILNSSDLLRKQIGSQGFFVSEDESCSYSHESSVSHHYYFSRNGANLPFLGCFVNMDRGGITCRADGTFAACIADGAGGESYFSAFLAQMICNDLMKVLSKGSVIFTENQNQNKEITTLLFGEIATSWSKYKGLHKGASTALFAECVSAGCTTSGKKKYHLQFGSIGDGAVIHVNNETKKAMQLNTIQRDLDGFGKPDVSSMGGCIYLGGLQGPEKIDASIHEITEDDHVILVTDGFLDNVKDNRIGEMVEAVIYQPFFDLSFERLESCERFWESGKSLSLPTVEQIKEFAVKNRGELPLDQAPTAEKITRRLWNYTKLVTFTRSQQEDLYYRGRSDFPLFDDHTPKPDDAMIITISPAKKRWY